MNKPIFLTLLFASALAAAAGILFGLAYPVLDPYMGVSLGWKAFVAAILGGAACTGMFKFAPALEAAGSFWGGPAIPSLASAALAGVAVPGLAGRRPPGAGRDRPAGHRRRRPHRQCAHGARGPGPLRSGPPAVARGAAMGGGLWSG